MRKSSNVLNWEWPKQALITGASAGIGLSFAYQLAALNFNLILIARRKEKLEEIALILQQKHEIKCTVISADLAVPADRAKVTEFIHSVEDIDLLVNNAGFGTLGYFYELPLEKIQKMMQVHLDATVEFSYAVIPQMLQRKRGAIINVASLNAFLYLPGNVIYGATKSFLKAFTESLALEVGYQGIIMQALCPGFTRTEFHKVGDYKKFKGSAFPKSLWMDSDSVVKISLKKLTTNQIVVIPGFKNRLLKFFFLHTPIGGIFQEKIRVSHDNYIAKMKSVTLRKEL